MISLSLFSMQKLPFLQSPLLQPSWVARRTRAFAMSRVPIAKAWPASTLNNGQPQPPLAWLSRWSQRSARPYRGPSPAFLLSVRPQQAPPSLRRLREWIKPRSSSLPNSLFNAKHSWKAPSLRWNLTWTRNSLYLSCSISYRVLTWSKWVCPLSRTF